MKRKFFATLLCLLMMATLLPTSSMAVESEETPLIVNGDFEDGKNGWNANGNTNVSVISGEDTAAEGETVSPLKGNALKIQGIETTRVQAWQQLQGLKNGRTYVVEGYVNSPLDNKSARVFISKKDGEPSSGSEVVAIFNKYGFPAADEGVSGTDGWLKFSDTFKYTDESNTPWRLYLNNPNTTSPIYFDEVHVYELEEDILVHETFDNYVSGYDLSCSMTKFTSKNEKYAAIEKVKENGVINGVWDTHPGNWGNTAVVLGFSDFTKIQAEACILHMTFRAKLVENKGTTDKPMVVPDIQLGKGSTARVRAYAATDFTLNQGDWVTYDFWFEYDPATWTTLGFTHGKNLKWYLDDLVITKANNSFVCNGKTVDYKEWTTSYAHRRASIDAGYTATDKVWPVVRYATKDATDVALTLTAVYKKEGTKKQLMTVVSETLNSTAEFSKETIDLSLLSLTAKEDVTYTVETFLWDGRTLVPLVKQGITPITVAQ